MSAPAGRSRRWETSTGADLPQEAAGRHLRRRPVRGATAGSGRPRAARAARIRRAAPTTSEIEAAAMSAALDQFSFKRSQSPKRRSCPRIADAVAAAGGVEIARSQGEQESKQPDASLRVRDRGRWRPRLFSKRPRGPSRPTHLSQGATGGDDAGRPRRQVRRLRERGARRTKRRALMRVFSMLYLSHPIRTRLRYTPIRRYTHYCAAVLTMRRSSAANAYGYSSRVPRLETSLRCSKSSLRPELAERVLRARNVPHPLSSWVP